MYICLLFCLNTCRNVYGERERERQLGNELLATPRTARRMPRKQTAEWSTESRGQSRSLQKTAEEHKDPDME